MTLRNLLATNCLLVGWGAFALLGCAVLAANVGPWPAGLPELWFAQLGLLAAAGIGIGVSLRRGPWQREKNIVAQLQSRSRFERLDLHVADMVPDQWTDGLFGIMWLP